MRIITRQIRLSTEDVVAIESALLAAAFAAKRQAADKASRHLIQGAEHDMREADRILDLHRILRAAVDASTPVELQ